MQQTVQALNIIIADDHKLFRKGIINLLLSMMEGPLLREAEDGKELLEMIRGQEPHLVILDLELPEIDGFDAAKHIIQNYPDVKILVLTMYDNEGFIEYLWELGVNGFLLKSAELDEMYNAVNSVVENGFFNNPTLDKVKANYDWSKTGLISTPQKLTPKEKEVLDLICREMTNKEIGKELDTSPRTIEKIRTRIMKNLHINTTVGLVKYALKNHLFKI